MFHNGLNRITPSVLPPSLGPLHVVLPPFVVPAFPAAAVTAAASVPPTPREMAQCCLALQVLTVGEFRYIGKNSQKELESLVKAPVAVGRSRKLKLF